MLLIDTARVLIRGLRPVELDVLHNSGAWASPLGIGAITGAVNAMSQYIQTGSVNPVDVAYAVLAGKPLSRGMRILLRMYFLIIFRSFIGVSAIKIVVIFIVLGKGVLHYPWGIDDIRFVLKQGALMSFVFCAFVTGIYVKNRR